MSLEGCVFSGLYCCVQTTQGPFLAMLESFQKRSHPLLDLGPDLARGGQNLASRIDPGETISSSQNWSWDHLLQPKLVAPPGQLLGGTVLLAMTDLSVVTFIILPSHLC